MRILGLIPARGGSKGVPGKNIKILGTMPLIQYTLESAHKSKLLDRVVVSTDSEEIAECVKSIGGQVPFLRPGQLSADDTPTLKVIQHTLDYYLKLGERFDAVCLLQVTSPFRVPGFIDGAITRFQEMKSDALISVLPVPAKYNPHWIFEPDSEGFMKIATGDKQIISRRQDLPRAYFRDGSIYITRTDVLLERNSLFGDRVVAIENDRNWHVNIDTIDDWAEAERMVGNYLQLCAR